ncbi:MAG: hypothetical protein AB7G51_08475 [Steroidobacteraceae bacterium]
MRFRFHMNGQVIEELCSERRMHLDEAARWFAGQLSAERLAELLALARADEVQLTASAFGLENIPFDQSSTVRLLELALGTFQRAGAAS